MFDNIGGKIKGYAQFVCWVGIIGSIITGLVFISIGFVSSDGGGIVIGGILIALVGSLTSWIGAFLTYGFGQLIENSDILVKQGNPCIIAPEQPNFIVKPKMKEYCVCDQTTAIAISETNIKWANCQRIQFLGNKVCSQCGAKFVKIEYQ